MFGLLYRSSWPVCCVRAPGGYAEAMSDECEHEPVPIEEPPFVSYSALPHPGVSSYTYCKHCGAPLRVRRSPRRQITIWAYREMHGYDPYKPSPIDPPRRD